MIRFLVGFVLGAITALVVMILDAVMPISVRPKPKPEPYMADVQPL